MYQDAAKTFARGATPSLIKSGYDARPPAGPAGTNLVFTSGYTPLSLVKKWYSEVQNCGPLPGCFDGKKGVVGRFAIMIWNGDKTIGCFNNTNKNISGCRYKAGDTLSCNTPNYSNAYMTNVFPKVKTFTECLTAVQTCGFSAPSGASEVTAIGYNELSDVSWDRPSAMPSLTRVLAVFAAGLAAVFAVFEARRIRAQGRSSKDAHADEDGVGTLLAE